ncbi:sugar ABC transporter ATP-binding protein [Azospirillum palustre]
MMAGGFQRSAPIPDPCPGALLEVCDIEKSFPGVRVLDGVSLDVRAGEVHVLFGENGAGKSTLVNIILGNYAPEGGTVRFDGKVLLAGSPRAARDAGISVVFQELSLIPTLSACANIFLGREKRQSALLDEGAMSREAAAIFARLGIAIDPQAPVAGLSRAEQQMVEIAKALQNDPRLLILDEPTTAFTDVETQRLFLIVAELKRLGVGIIYITHRMAEIQAIGDRISILRDGRRIATKLVSETDEDELIQLMTGRETLNVYPTIAFKPADEAIALEGASAASGRFQNVSISVRAGEIVGIAGLVGCGKSAVGRSLFGEERLAAGQVKLFGKSLRSPSPQSMLDAGVVYLPPDRRRQGLVLNRSVRENATLSCLNLRSFAFGQWLRKKSEDDAVQRVLNRLNLTPPLLDRNVSAYSGGNQQKVVFARAFLRETKVLIVDEPTVGVDVGARLEFYGILKQLCEAGAAILLISSDLPEILHLTHRTYVLAFGRQTAEFQQEEISEAAILSSFFAVGRKEGDIKTGAAA